MKLKTKILVALSVIWIIVTPLFLLAYPQRLVQNGNVYLRAHQLDWNTFHFEPRVHDIEGQPLSYLWEFSDGYTHSGREFIRSFDAGNYTVKMTAIDYYGRYYAQDADLKIRFWTLTNKWFWGILFVIIVILIVYYWLGKLIYKANQKIIDKEVGIFLDQLEKMDFWSNLVKAIKSRR